jgi:GTP-binding protein HflX
MYKSLSRQKSGTGSKGPGEQQLELDRRLLRNKISHLKRELRDLVKVRRTQRQKRNKNIIKTVALAGYTNSGKSTLMNAIINYSKKQNKDLVYTKDMLFATLETKTEKIDIANGYNFLLTDTVGFIEKLPHDLIEAFKSTLEEIKEASLILHVIDVSNPNYNRQIETVEMILSDLGAQEIPVIYVYNKIDLIEDLPLVSQNNSVFISAQNEKNIDILVEEINNIIYHNHKVKMLIPFSDSSIYSELKKNTKILETNYLDDGISIEVQLNDYYYEKYKSYIK